MPNLFLPEGRLLDTPENQAACSTRASLAAAMAEELILEGMVTLCDAGHDLLVQVGPFTGRIPRHEAALGIAEGNTREIAILSRVGKPVAFTVLSLAGPNGARELLLSRRRAQELALAHLLQTLRPGMVIPATVTHLEHFGAFVDVACGVTSMISIEHLSVSRILHPNRRLARGQELLAAVLSVDRTSGRIALTHKELLGTWEENAAHFTEGTTVPGYIRGIKDYGVFIELAPNLSGLAELQPGLRDDSRVSVYIKAILPAQMKIKLLIIDRLPPVDDLPPLRYFITGGRLTSWRHAPALCPKKGVETVFEAGL